MTCTLNYILFQSYYSQINDAIWFIIIASSNALNGTFQVKNYEIMIRLLYLFIHKNEFSTIYRPNIVI